MMNFDSALRESCVVRENRTNTPLQALNMMNDVTFVESARFIGQRMLREGGTLAADRLSYGFRLLTGRTPTAQEAQILRRAFCNITSTTLRSAGKSEAISYPRR